MAAYHTVKDIRTLLLKAYLRRESDEEMIELLGVSFRADDDHIFGAPNNDYIARELMWYSSESLNVYDIPGGPPPIWKHVADPNGKVNSNYGFLLHSAGNGHQFDNVVMKLIRDANSRQAIAIYTRPSMHDDWEFGGRADFVCTNTVQYLIRTFNGEPVLTTVVNMRSNDAVYGYRNDYAWQRYATGMIVQALKPMYPDLVVGDTIWQVGSLHVYPRHHNLIQRFANYGVHNDTV